MKSKINLNFLVFFTLFLASVVGGEMSVAHFFRHSTISPPLSMLYLALLAAFFSWRQVMIATPFFVLTSYLLIDGVALFPSVRAFSVLVAGGLAAWIACQRERGDRRSAEISAILDSLPIPWVLSDSTGNITLANKDALVVLSQSSLSTVIGTSYFSFFSPAEGKGVFIQKYLDIFMYDSPPLTMSLLLANTSPVAIHATLSRIHLPQGVFLLTAFR